MRPQVERGFDTGTKIYTFQNPVHVFQSPVFMFFQLKFHNLSYWIENQCRVLQVDSVEKHEQDSYRKFILSNFNCLIRRDKFSNTFFACVWKRRLFPLLHLSICTDRDYSLLWNPQLLTAIRWVCYRFHARFYGYLFCCHSIVTCFNGMNAFFVCFSVVCSVRYGSLCDCEIAK